MKVQVLPSARRDLLDGYEFYRHEREDVARHFLSSVSADITSLEVYGGIHPTIDDDMHMMPARRFPFAIYYRVQGGAVTIYAVLDCRRNPEWIRRRLKS